VLLASQSPHLRGLLVAMDLMRPVLPLTPEDPLDQAMELFVESDLLALPVVDGLGSKNVLGIVKRGVIAPFRLITRFSWLRDEPTLTYSPLRRPPAPAKTSPGPPPIHRSTTTHAGLRSPDLPPSPTSYPTASADA